MIHLTAFIARGTKKAKGMRTANYKRNSTVHGPTCTTWPPPWLNATALPAPAPAPPTPPQASENLAEPNMCDAVHPEFPKPPDDVSPWDLTPDLYELWEERVCIMH